MTVISGVSFVESFSFYLLCCCFRRNVCFVDILGKRCGATTNDAKEGKCEVLIQVSFKCFGNTALCQILRVPPQFNVHFFKLYLFHKNS
jgi:hypothetical protein